MTTMLDAAASRLGPNLHRPPEQQELITWMETHRPELAGPGWTRFQTVSGMPIWVRHLPDGRLDIENPVEALPLVEVVECR